MLDCVSRHDDVSRASGDPGPSARNRDGIAGATLALLVRMHRILVLADHHSSNPQARTYAEYRVFAAVARHIRRVRRVRVVLQSSEEKPPREDRVACAITVALGPTGSLRIRAKGSHVYAAINGAVEQLDRALEGRVRTRGAASFGALQNETIASK